MGDGFYAINPDFMQERKTVELTEEEKAKLENVKKYAKEFENYYEKSSGKAYMVEPNVKDLPSTKTYGKSRLRIRTSNI